MKENKEIEVMKTCSIVNRKADCFLLERDKIVTSLVRIKTKQILPFYCTVSTEENEFQVFGNNVME
jgi:hypothetical protein